MPETGKKNQAVAIPEKSALKKDTLPLSKQKIYMTSKI